MHQVDQDNQVKLEKNAIKATSELVKLVIELKQNWAMLLMYHISWSKCNMTLIQQPGQKKLLISNPKAHGLNAANIYYMNISS